MPATFSTSRRDVVNFVQNILQQRPVYLDTETTGLDKTAEIVEISVIDDDGQCLFESLVKPSQPIPSVATQVHGITNEMIQGMRSWPILWPTIRPYLLGRPVVIYNAEFDLRMMEQSHTRYRLPWREKLNGVCAMQLYSQYRNQWDPVRRSYRFIKLEDAGKQCQISLPNSHRAQADALLARALFHYMAEHE